MLGLASALPFVGFGFLDNFLMILFGEFIDNTLCVFFSFSTMAAAAIGNTVSDAAGIFSGGAVEELAMRCGVEEPPLNRAQRQMRVTKVWLYMGQVVGILLGCTLGCCPLLWLDPEHSAKLKQEKQQDAIFQGVVDKVAQMLHAEAVELIMVDNERGDLYSRNVTSNLHHHRWRRTDGFIGDAIGTGKFVNVPDVREESRYDPKLHDNFLGTGIQVRSLLCMPVYSKGEVAGMIVVINKKDGAFTTRDEDVLSAISTHVAVAMGDSRQNFEEVLENCEKSMAQQKPPMWNVNTTHRRKTLISSMLKGMSALLDAESIVLMLLDEEQGELYTEAAEGSACKQRVRLGEGFAGWSVQQGLTLNLGGGGKPPERSWWCRGNEASLAHLSDANFEDVRSVLCVPIFDTNMRCLGVFQCINKRTNNGAFDAEDVRYVQQVADYFAIMLEGPTAELRRALALTRDCMQRKAARRKLGPDRVPAVMCFLDQVEDHGVGTSGRRAWRVDHGDPLAEERASSVQALSGQRPPGSA